MLKKILGEGKKSQDSSYRYWRWRIFYSTYIGYAIFYFTRKSFTFALPMMMDDLSLSAADFGVVGSSLYISYALSKLVSGPISDKANPRYFMSIGLLLTGVFNILFGFSSSLILMAVLWALNGFFQGWGWPACTKQLTFWFSKQERGFWWGLSSTSHNLGGALIPLFIAGLAVFVSWRWCLVITGALAAIVAVFLLERLRSTPESLGFASVEGDVSSTQVSDQELFKLEIFTNTKVWLLAISYFFIYILRTSLSDWLILFFNRERHHSMVEAASALSLFELGGLLGCIAGGLVSDRLFKGKRVPCVLWSAIGFLFVSTVFFVFPGQGLIIDGILVTVLGFLVFIPQMLVGLAAVEEVDRRVACTANGFVGSFGYAGAAITGYPLGFVIDNWQWQGFFMFIAVCTVSCCLCLLALNSSENFVKYLRIIRG